MYERQSLSNLFLGSNHVNDFSSVTSQDSAKTLTSDSSLIVSLPYNPYIQVLSNPFGINIPLRIPLKVLTL
ncbi:hypothetical protein Terranova_066 [Staphylococcus phage Terranova]|nr:hypothetical protein Quidividi_063 [Staphylococcus phage Quidividi]AXY83949.1 hypothetical protein Terranova_066 [Staphylococcus phage Terranova]